ncbi:MAG: YceI family protein [Alphaproteobacteria bacterium]
MRILSSILASLLLFASPAMAADENKYDFDKSHTRILFFIDHLGFSETVGDFTDYDGHFVFDEKEPAKSSVDVTLKVAGIRTVSQKLDEHLMNEDFFNEKKFPTIRFTSKEVKVTGKDTAEITGDVTMLGVTKPVTLHVKLNKVGFYPMGDVYAAGFTANATLKRSDFGMNHGLPMVGDDVRIEIYTEGHHVTKKKPAANKQ